MGLGKTVWERNIWFEIGDSGQMKMLLFREVGALLERDHLGYRPINKMVKIMIEWVGIYIYKGDVSQNGAFRENESGKGTFG